MQITNVAPSPPYMRLPDRMVIWLLAACAVVAPVCFGASGIWARWALEAAMTVAVVLWASSGNRPAYCLALPLATMGIGLLQLLPLPDSLLLRIAPISAGAWKLVLGGGTAACISVDPAATLAVMRRLSLAVAIACVVYDLGHHQRFRKTLSWALGTSCVLILGAAMIFGRGASDFTMMRGLVSLRGPMHPLHSPLILPGQGSGVATIDPVSVGTRRYAVDSSHTGDGCGFYIYSNHFAGGITLTLPVLITTLLAATYRRWHQGLRLTLAFGLYGLGLWSVGWLADSRAGFGSLIVAGQVAALLATHAPLAKKIAAAIFTITCAATAIAGMLLLGPWSTSILNAIPDRASAALTAALDGTGRLAAAFVALRMFRASPVLGAGLGTFQSIFPRFQPAKVTFFYAHNDWAQLLAETGLMGGLGIVAIATWMLRKGLQFYRLSQPPARIFDAGAWAALAGIAFHSAFDWNLHLPANTFLASIVAGLAASSTKPASAASLKKSPWAAVIRICFVLAFIMALGWLTRDALSATAQRALNRAIVADRIAAANPELPSARQALEAAIAAGERMVPWDRRNARLLVLMGQASLHLANRIPESTVQEAVALRADQWFARARRASPVCRGLPEEFAPAR